MIASKLNEMLLSSDFLKQEIGFTMDYNLELKALLFVTILVLFFQCYLTYYMHWCPF